MVLSQAVSLLLVSLAAAILPSLSRLLRLPGPVLEILFGVLIGKGLLNLHFSGEWLQFLAHLGFLLLMFHSGMELDFVMLRKQSRTDLLFQLGIFLVSLTLSLAAAVLLGHGLFLGLVLTTTSLGLVMPVLKEAGASKTHFGQMVLIAASLADFLTLLGITFYILWVEQGLSWRFLSPLPLLFGFGVLLWAGRLWAWWNPEQADTVLGGRDTLELGVRLSLALLFLLVAVSEMVHLEPVLGAFLGGAVLSFVFREKVALENKLSAIGFGFLIPIFFIHVGMQFDLHALLVPEQVILALSLLLVAFGVKLIPGLLFRLRGLSLRRSFQAGFLLSARLSLIVAAATIGVDKGLIEAGMKDIIVALALLTCLLGPMLFKVLGVREAQAGKPQHGRAV